jgi:hypothetical protein
LASSPSSIHAGARDLSQVANDLAGIAGEFLRIGSAAASQPIEKPIAPQTERHGPHFEGFVVIGYQHFKLHVDG